MDINQITDVFRDGIGVVGVLTAILQAVTQIHEQTVSFVLKLIVVVLFLIFGGNWMLTTLQDYTLELFGMMLP